MKLSLQYYTMVPLLRKNKINTEQIFKYAVEDGYEAIEYLLVNPSMDIEPVKTLLDKYSLTVSCVDCFFDFANSDEEVFNSQVELSHLAVNQVQKLGSKYLMVVPAYEESVKDKELAIKNIIKGLKLLVNYAETKGIIVTIEDYPNQKVPLCSISDIDRILKEVPGLYLTFDTGNFFVAEDDSEEALRKLKGYVKNVHAKDWMIVENGTYTETKSGKKITSAIHGQGIINFDKLFHILLEMSYDGYISVEYEGDLEDLEPIKECTKYLKGLLKND